MIGFTQEKFVGQIVAKGKFSPSQVTPDWLQKYELIGAEDRAKLIDDASLVVTHRHSKYSVDWFSIDVIPEFLSIDTGNAFNDNVVDLICGVITLLHSSEVDTVAINFHAHYKASDEDLYNKIGHAIAPKDFWSRILSVDEKVEKIGLRSMRMDIEPRVENLGEDRMSRRITVEASNVVSNAIYLALSVEYRFSDSKTRVGFSDMVVEKIRELWGGGVDESVQIFEDILKQGSRDHV